MSEDIIIRKMDHLGLIAGIVRELRIVEYIDSVITPDPQEVITTGECVLALLLNALGFVGEPLYMMPHYFKNLDLNVLLGKNISAEELNTFKLSRALDKLYNYGLTKLFNEISILCCGAAKIDTTYNSMDTTSFSLTGEYDSSADTHEVMIKHGYSKDHRPDLKQVILELISTQDGGVPLLMQCHDGNKSDNVTFKDRVEKIVSTIKDGELEDNGSILIADSKLYTKKTAEYLNRINYITRIPTILKCCSEAIQNALNSNDPWLEYSDTEKYKKINVTHYNITQRWIIVYSEAANSRAKKRINKEIAKDEIAIQKLRKQMKKLHFDNKCDILDHIITKFNKYKFHTLDENTLEVTETKSNEFLLTEFQFFLHMELAEENIKQNSCYVVGTNTRDIDVQNLLSNNIDAEVNNTVSDATALTDTNEKYNTRQNISYEKISAKEVVARYKKQNDTIENKGFKFLKSPLFFASSFFAKLPRRIESLIFIMCLSLLVYSIAQLKVRNILKENRLFIFNQLNKPTQNPTLQWIFKLLSGIYITSIVMGNNEVKRCISGLDDTKRTILSYFGATVLSMYDLAKLNSSSLLPSIA